MEFNFSARPQISRAMFGKVEVETMFVQKLPEIYLCQSINVIWLAVFAKKMCKFDP